METANDDEFQFLEDGPEWMNVDVPEENVLSHSESSLFANFQSKLAALRLEVCEACCEKDFNMDIRNGMCHRCRSDRGDPVRKFANENNINPGGWLLQKRTDYEPYLHPE